jgi:hypothetical protein
MRFAIALALALGATITPVSAENYPSRIVMRVFSPMPSIALTVEIGHL